MTNTSDEELVSVANELQSNIVPATGYTHALCRRVNQMIDSGDLCINPTTYRKVYLPTMARAVHKELAHRYVVSVSIGDILI